MIKRVNFSARHHCAIVIVGTFGNVSRRTLFRQLRIMNLTKIFLSLGLIVAGFACFQNVSAQAKNNPQTVTDYYLLLPKRFLPILESVRNRRSIIKIEDAKNGYLRLEGAWEGWAKSLCFAGRTAKP